MWFITIGSVEMNNKDIELDNTTDLRRVAKIYGTKKPFKNSKVSRFFGEKRMEDSVLRESLLSLDIDETIESDIVLVIPDGLPENFIQLLDQDPTIQNLWNNRGKIVTLDISRSGYDFTLIKECIKKGITDINELSAILALRPEGAVQKSGKNEQYIKRTIGNALFK